MQVRVRIRRYDPAQDQRPRYQEYVVDAEPEDRLLDVLNRIKWEIDGTLTFRRSCAHGVCGSDAMLINGVNRLACKVLVRDLGSTITVEPLRGFPVVKDLVVDMTGFFKAYRAVKPWLINDETPPPTERLQSPSERERFDDTTKCILCASCTTSCPSFWSNPEYIGPAAIVNAHRFIFDSRDRGAAERLDVLNSREGVWRCRTIFNCTDACPRGIEVTRAIQDVKRLLLTERV
ncbi:MAG: succinate dehydrogenase iron-sulfur subunit [Thermaerobacter sp.]|nr:succinate dehydrogenase iron-sulfur subunit [Bacillota bacterium]REJ37965.1 MAG: succinate dehydrogenase iron-sulfur subunit [Bacillota bacterium]